MFKNGFSVHFIVRKIEHSIDFYTTVLGFELLEQKSTSFAVLSGGPVKLYISAVGARGDSLLEKDKGLGAKFQVEVDNVDEFYENVKSLVPHKITQELSTYPYGWRAFSVTDYDGYEWTLYSEVVDK